VMVWMMPQSEPAGQQMTDCTSVLSRFIHFVLVGQQNSDG
jgi:hypothetical protein